MEKDPSLGRELLPLQESDPVLQHLDFIFGLLPQLSLFQHFNTFFDQVLSIFDFVSPIGVIPLLAGVAMALVLLRSV